jgi:hypothetical protein
MWMRHTADTLQTLVLGSLSLHMDCYLTDGALTMLAHCHALRELTLDGISHLSARPGAHLSAAAAAVAVLPSVEELLVERRGACSACKQRQSHRTRHQQKRRSGFTDRAFEDSIARIPRLAELRLRRAPEGVTDRALAALSRHCNGTLTLLDIGENGSHLQMADALIQCQALTSLGLSWTCAQADERLVAVLCALPRLTQLTVASCVWMTDQLCVQIAALP